MKKRSFTKGPFKVDKRRVVAVKPPKGFKPNSYHPDYVIAQCSTYCSPPYDETVANCQLFSEAPEMYKILRYLAAFETGNRRFSWAKLFALQKKAVKILDRIDS